MATRILFVCLGNICRSPLAEALLKHKIETGDYTNDIYADSAGTSDYHIGELPDARTLRNAAQHGIEMSHIGRQFEYKDFSDFAHILVMDRQNMRNVLTLAKTESDRNKVQLMRNFDPDNIGTDVPDPWFGGEEGFQEVFEILDRCVTNLLRDLS